MLGLYNNHMLWFGNTYLSVPYCCRSIIGSKTLTVPSREDDSSNQRANVWNLSSFRALKKNMKIAITVKKQSVIWTCVNWLVVFEAAEADRDKGSAYRLLAYLLLQSYAL